MGYWIFHSSIALYFLQFLLFLVITYIHLQGRTQNIYIPPTQIGGICYSHTFLVQKSSAKFRFILKLKQVNTFVKYKSFKMESIYTRELVSYDLRDAYLHITLLMGVQKIPQVRNAERVQDVIFSVQFSAIRPSVCSLYLHESAGRSFSGSKVRGDPNNPLLR